METSKRGRFNYALWTHEMTYKLGEQSQAAPGVDGYMSATSTCRVLCTESSRNTGNGLRTSFGGGSAGEDTRTDRVDRR
ncbi:hypothetical protein P7H19_10590 [Paenibacillus larvae]|nr:hypothetical protein [Paenibacillus larvae]MDT2236653.1 hypothetical protein [Paenibacillus larvae]